MENNNPSASVSASANAAAVNPASDFAPASAKTAVAGTSSVRTAFAAQLFELLKLYSRYMIRSVMTKGILRRKEIRWAAAGLALLWLAGVPVFVYIYFKKMGGGDPSSLNAGRINEIYGAGLTSLIFYCLLLFLIMKTLFGKATGLAELTEQMPVTGRMKAVSFLSFEMAASAIAAFCLMCPGLVGISFAVSSQAFVPLILHYILAPLLVFSALNVVWQAVGSFMRLLKLPRYASIVSSSVFAMLIVVFSVNGIKWSMTAQSHFAVREDKITFLTFVADIASQYGYLSCGLLLAVGIAVLMFLALLLTPKYYQLPENFVYNPLPAVAKNDFMLFLAYVVRLPVNIEALFLCIGYQIASYCSHDYGNILMCLVLLVCAAVYQFANGIEEQWRMKRGESAGYLYLCLLVSQILYAGFFWLISSIVLAAGGHFEIQKCLTSFIAIIVGSIIFFFFCIAFPSTKNNPFSVIVGVSSVMFSIFVLLLGVSIFELTGAALYCLCAVSIVILMIYSVWGIQTDIKRRKIGKN